MTGVIGILIVAIGLSMIGFYVVAPCVRGFEDYEKRYLARTEGHLDVLFSIMPAEQLFRLSLASCAAGGILGFALVRGAGVLLPVLIAILFGAIGFVLPKGILFLLLNRRRQAFLAVFPDALAMLANGLKAGLSVQLALDMVGREMVDPVGQEFRLIGRDRQAGRSIEECMERLAMRMPLDDVRIFTMVLRLAQRMGGDVTVALHQVAETVRNRFVLARKIRTMTTQIRMQAIIMVCMPFIIAGLLSLVAPELIRPLIGTSAGAFVLVAVLILEICGGIMMWRIARVKY